jgi:VanZ family protein
VTGYAGLTFWIGLALIATGAPPRRRVVGIALVLAAYGVFDELTQPIFGRTASIRDWLADLVGIAVGLATAELTALIALRRAAAQRKR